MKNVSCEYDREPQLCKVRDNSGFIKYFDFLNEQAICIYCRQKKKEAHLLRRVRCRVCGKKTIAAARNSVFGLFGLIATL